MTDAQGQPASDEQRLAYAKVIARVWSDEAFKTRLQEDPAAILKEAGIDVPSDVSLKVVQNTATVRHIVLPAPPPEGELAEDDLERVAGGNYVLTSPDL